MVKLQKEDKRRLKIEEEKLRITGLGYGEYIKAVHALNLENGAFGDAVDTLGRANHYASSAMVTSCLESITYICAGPGSKFMMVMAVLTVYFAMMIGVLSARLYMHMDDTQQSMIEAEGEEPTNDEQEAVDEAGELKVTLLIACLAVCALYLIVGFAGMMKY